MTSELEDRYNDLRFSPYGTAFLTDAIIVQRYIEVDSRLQRVHGRGEGSGQRAFERVARVHHRRRRHPDRRRCSPITKACSAAGQHASILPTFQAQPPTTLLAARTVSEEPRGRKLPLAEPGGVQPLRRGLRRQ